MYRIEEKDKAIQSVQRLLAIKETGVYDKNTSNSVAEHQSKNSLPETGIVDYTTFMSLVKEYKTRIQNKKDTFGILADPSFPYKPGDHSADIGYINAVLRNILSDYRFEYKLPYGNYYNDDTVNAVKTIRDIFQMTPGNDIDISLFKRMLVEHEAIAIKRTLK